MVTSSAGDPEEGREFLGLSHRLAALHIGGVALLIFVVLVSVLWISAEHNKLALLSSENLVRGGIGSFRARAITLVEDYSIWDEAYEAVERDDREWLYNNIGTAVTEIQTLDVIELVYRGSQPSFGWQFGSPREGEPGPLPPDLEAAILSRLDGNPTSDEAKTLIASWKGEPWVFAVAPFSRVSPTPGEITPPPAWQIHGMHLFGDRLTQIGRNVLVDGLTFSDHPQPDKASIEVADFTGRTIGYITWDPPRPGASILRRVALPLGAALLVVAVISAISARYAVRSALRLERALFDAKAADRSKTEFLSNVSHELRTPMNGILGVAQLLQTTDLDPEQSELVAVLFASARTQMSLISDLLDLSRLESGAWQGTVEPFDPASILQDLAEMMRVAANRKKIELAGDWTQLAGLTLEGDQRAFRQIVTNLLGNAVKFTDRGRVTLTATVALSDTRAELRVRVQDTGRGIPQESLARIFERFYQVDGSTTRANEGTGLGLAISQQLAQMMGGEILACSEYGVGSAFELAVGFDLAASGRALDAA